MAQASGWMFKIAGANRLSRVFHDEEIVLRGDLIDRAHVGHLSVQVHRNDRTRARRDGRFDLGRVDVKGIGLDIDEHGPCAGAPDRAGRREERVRSGDHLVAAADICCHQGQEESVGAGCAADSSGDAAQLGDLGFERSDLRAHDEHLTLEEPEDDGLDLIANGLILRLQVEDGNSDGLERDSHRRTLP